MSYRELFVSPSLVFGGYPKTFEESKHVILGVPFDATSTFRPGARFAPTAIREASLNIETHSFRAGVDIEDLNIHDLGNLDVAGDVHETLRRVELVVKELLNADKLPVLIGGEHTITLGAMRALRDTDVALLGFDAHLDLRDEYMGQRTSHTTFMRRIHEQIRPKAILEVGTRAVCREELEYAEKHGIQFFTTQQIRRDGSEKTVEKLREALDGYESIYLTIDIDALDPAFAPAVQNPEPDGLFTHEFLDILCGICDRRVAIFDVVEVAPQYDHGITAIQAAKTIFEVLCHLERA